MPIRPLIFNASRKKECDALDTLIESGQVRRVSDCYHSQAKESFAADNPDKANLPAFSELFEAWYRKLLQTSTERELGRWVYFPWNGALMHILEDEEFQKVRTARNNPLLTPEEQSKFYNSTIAVAGLSVGSAIVLTIVLQGGARRLRLADSDSLELSNLNRIRAGIDDIGIPKVDITARQVYSLNPYSEIEIFPQGITNDSLQQFVDGADVLIDEIDSLEWKFRIREMAARTRIPVLMVADLDRTSIVDVERYDLETISLFFNGAFGDISIADVTNLDKKTTGQMIARLVGIENHTPKMLEALREIGKTVVSWPQLGPTAAMGAAFAAHCTERILLKKVLPSGRTVISAEALFDPAYNTEESKRARQDAQASFQRAMKES